MAPSLSSLPTSLPLLLPSLYLLGVLTSLTPCVLSLLPLTLSYITVTALPLPVTSVMYTLGLLTTFCSVGVGLNSGMAMLDPGAATIRAVLFGGLQIYMGERRRGERRRWRKNEQVKVGKNS